MVAARQNASSFYAHTDGSWGMGNQAPPLSLKIRRIPLIPQTFLVPPEPDETESAVIDDTHGEKRHGGRT